MGIRLILVEAHMEKQHRTIRIPFQHFIFLHSRPYRELILILGIILGEHGTPNNREHSSQTILVRVMALFDEVWHYYFSQSNSSLCSSSDLLPDSTTLSWDALCRFSIISCRVCPTTKRYLKVWSHGFSWAEVIICFFLDSFFHVQTSCESSFVDALPIQGSTDRTSWSARIPWIPAPIPEMWLGTPYPWCGHKVALFCSSAPPTHHHSALYVVHYWKILHYATVNHIICVVSTIWLYIATSPMSICLNGAHNDHW